MFHNDAAARSAGGGGGEGGGGEGEIDAAGAPFPARRSEGIYCGGMMIYVRGGGCVGDEGARR